MRDRFAIFWRGVAGWPYRGRAREGGESASRYLLGLRRGLIPDFHEAPDGHIHFTARVPLHALSPEREMQCSSDLAVQKCNEFEAGILLGMMR